MTIQYGSKARCDFGAYVDHLADQNETLALREIERVRLREPSP